MESIPAKDPLNFVITTLGPDFTSYFDNALQPLKKKYNINYYFVNYPVKDSEIETLKTKNITFICCHAFKTACLPSLLNNLPNIKWVHTLSAGVDKYFNIPEFSEKVKSNKIIFSNNSGACSECFGEVGITAMLYFSYNIYNYVDAMKNKQWLKPFPTNKMLQNKKLLIIGYGKNGVCLAKRAKNGFDMKIVGVVRTLRENINGKEFVEKIYCFKNLPDNVINEADFIFATLPGCPENVNIFDKSFFNKMNKNAVFINVGRGNTVVENDLFDVLENNNIRGAVIDVTQKEPLDKDSNLYKLSPNKLLITNHCLGIVNDYMEKGMDFFVKLLEYYLETGKHKNLVDTVNQY